MKYTSVYIPLIDLTIDYMYIFLPKERTPLKTVAKYTVMETLKTLQSYSISVLNWGCLV